MDITKKTSFYIGLIAVLIVFLATTYNVIATTIPTFPSCLNPQGELKQPALQGIHGVPGNGNTFTGMDTVYKLTSDTLMQCLCPADGSGIQTNWWKVSQLSESEIEDLKNGGWFYVPDGEAWGLDPAPYMIQNSTYSCIGGKGGGEPGSTSSSSTGSTSSTNTSAGSNILGLASTGTIKTVYFYFIAGIVFLVAGLIMKSYVPKKLNK